MEKSRPFFLSAHSVLCACVIVGGFMARGAKNQLPLVNVLGAPTLRDGSVGRWDGKESFFSDGFDVGGHP